MRSTSKLAGAALGLAFLVSACGGGGGSEPASATGETLVGLFKADPGKCGSKNVSGSYMRMIQPEADLEEGPFVDNGDSPCADQSFTPFVPGAEGGLSTVDFQPDPKPPFDDEGNALAETIMEPQGFYGIGYSVSTNPVDPQTGDDTEIPQISVAEDGTLSGEIQGWVVAWNGQYFNQGAPKPDGSTPGLTAAPTGTYDPETGRFTLDWTSAVRGGPFDGFTGIWHLEGIFEAS